MRYTKGIRLAFKYEYEDYWSGRYTSTDKWDSGEQMLASCCGADWYGRLINASKLSVEEQEKHADNEHGIAIYRGKLKLKSNNERQIDTIKTKSGWLTVWNELPGPCDNECDESEEW